MFCPNCGNEVSSENFCTNCGVELAYVDNNVVIKEHYLEVKGVHDSMDTFISDCENGLNTVKDYVDNDKLLLEFDDNPSEINDFLISLDDAENNLIGFRSTIYECLDDNDHIEYLRSMNYLFGDVDNKINKCLSLIESYLNYITIFRDKIYNYKINSDNDDSNTISVEEYHSQIDEIISNIDSVNELFTNQLQQQDMYEELRNDNNQRESLKENIKESLKSFNEFEKTLNENLQPKKLKELKKFDSKYGDIEEKMIQCKSKMKDTRKILSKCMEVINNIEKPENNTNIKLNNKRIIDL